MALTWFQNWNPPTQLPTDTSFHAPVGNLSHVQKPILNYQKDSINHNNRPISNLLPFVMQLGLMQTPKTNLEHLERTGPFVTWYQWKMLDFQYPSEYARLKAISRGDYIPENNLPLGVEVYKNRMFLTMPRWKQGVPATLAVVPKRPKELSPKLEPYPSWEYHNTNSCDGLTSVFRLQADICGRLWVLDSGQINVTTKPTQVCPPQIFIFDLHTDELLLRYDLPEKFVKQDGLYSNIKVDVRDGECENAHAYLTDVWRYGLVVFSLKRMRSWLISDHLFYPEPLAAAYNLHGLEFQWVDGIFSMSLSPYNRKAQDRLLYFHPMSSFREFFVKTSVICNETGWSNVKDAFQVIGQSRGRFGHASASAMDRNGIMFINLVSRDSIGCWDSRKPYKRDNVGVVAKSTRNLVFPNDVKVDLEERQSVWVLSNRLPFFLYRGLNKSDFNFRIMSAYVDDAIEGTICDPKVSYFDTFKSYPDGDDCY